MSNVESATTEQGPSCLPADGERAEEAVSQVTQATPSQDPSAKTESNNSKVEPAMSQQGPENMEVEKEEEEEEEEEEEDEEEEEEVEEKKEEETTPSVKQEASAELLNKDSDCTPVTELFSKDPPKLPASPALVNKTEQKRSPCQEHRSPSPLSLSVDTRGTLSAADIEGRLLPHSEEEEEEEDEDDEPMKGDEHIVVIKQEMHEQDIKPELLLDEMSNMSHGDESSSGFMGSPGEPDPHISMEFGLVPAGRSHPDALLSETDDSLPFEPLRSDREKVKRRGSPGRSRVKQVRSPCV